MEYSLDLPDPHGFLVWTGRRTAMLARSPLPTDASYVITGGGKAWAKVTVGEPQLLAVKELESRSAEHQVKAEEAAEWWPKLDAVYLQKFETVERYDPPLSLSTNGKQAEAAQPAVAHHGEHAVMMDQVGMGGSPKPGANVADFLESRIHKGYTDAADDLLAAGYLSKDERIELSSAVTSALAAFRTTLESGLGQLAGRAIEAEAALELTGKQEQETTTMPYMKVKDGDETCVYKKGPDGKQTGKTLGCHPTEKEANAQIAALNANEVAAKAKLEGRESDEQQTRAIMQAFHDAFDIVKELPGGQTTEVYPWISDTYTDEGAFIVELDGKSYRVNYEEADGAITFDPPETWQEVVRYEEWRPVPLPEMMMGTASRVLMGAKGLKTQPPAAAAGAPEPSIKAGRRMRGDKLRMLKGFRKTMNRLMKELSEVLGWADYAEADKGLVGGIKLIDGPDGEKWVLTWTTNSFEDRDKEIFTAEALEDYVKRHEDEEAKGAFWFWHIPGSKFGTIKWQGMSGRFLVEAGPFDETDVGKAFKAFLEEHPDGHPTIAPEGWGTSHGFVYKSGDREDGVYDWLEKHETTVLPGHVAANPYNPGKAMEVFTVDKKQRAALEAIGGKDLADQVVALGEGMTKDLEDAGVAYKAALAAQVQPIIEGTKDAALKSALQAALKAEEPKAAVMAAAAKAKGADAKTLAPILAALGETPPEPPASEPKGEETEPPAPESVGSLRAEVSEAFKARAEGTGARLNSIEAKLDQLVTVVAEANTLEAEKAGLTPRASLKAVVTSAIGNPATRVDGRTALAKSEPKETPQPTDEGSGIPLLGRIKQLNAERTGKGVATQTPAA